VILNKYLNWKIFRLDIFFAVSFSQENSSKRIIKKFRQKKFVKRFGQKISSKNQKPSKRVN
jgi:hypothetical protein